MSNRKKNTLALSRFLDAEKEIAADRSKALKSHAEVLAPPEPAAPIVPTEAEIAAAVAETHTLALAPRSVVRPAYKRAYAAKALADGRTSKAAKRANGDWLARELEAETIAEDGTFLLDRFCAICEANGVGNPLVRWPNRNNGWEGRLRMSGSIVLRGIVRKAGVLVTPDTTVQAPAAFCAR